MSITLPKDYPLYDTVYGTEIPTEQYFVICYNKLPSKYVNSLSYDPSIINFFINKLGFVEDVNVFSSNRRYDLSSQSLYVNNEKNIMIRITGNVVKDKDPLVVINAIEAINEIQADKGGIEIDRALIIPLLNRIKDFNEWGQSIILDICSKYAP